MHSYEIALPCHLYKNFTYTFEENLTKGQIVVCSLRKKLTIGMVIDSQTNYSGPLKAIDQLLPLHLSKIQYDFILWFSEYTLTPLGVCLKLIFPLPLEDIFKTLIQKNTFKEASICYQKATLNNEQQHAVEEVIKHSNSFQTFLLDGVTGSGKTEVYFTILHEIIQKKQQALILLPEISLTKQWLERFKERFGIMPFLWHSKVTKKNKRDILQAIYNGESCIVVGTRSALFLPFQNLGFIVVDEEHDASYKQEEQIIYNARDIAIVLASFHQCPIILSSATPSLESYHNAQINRYKTLSLTKRFSNIAFPSIELIDQRSKQKTQQHQFISTQLITEISKNLENNEQTLLFINRRGYAPLMLCNACGFHFHCDHCSASLIYHDHIQKLKCHHCNHEQQFPTFCPDCGTKDQFIPCGPGIERLTEEVKKHFPKARLLQISSDLLSTQKNVDEAIQNILDHNVDIIIGTQIMAKGHHFPNLTLIGIIDADMSLSGIDLRSCEKTFQLLFQVIGRAGREKKIGRVYIQTHNPEHPVIHSLQNHDKDNFLKAEYEQRQLFNMPPFSKLASITIASHKKDDLLKAASLLAKKIPQNIVGCQILGPSVPPLSKIRGRERKRFLLLAEKNVNRQKIIAQWVLTTKLPSSIRLSIDIDPYSFF